MSPQTPHEANTPSDDAVFFDAPTQVSPGLGGPDEYGCHSLMAEQQLLAELAHAAENVTHDSSVEVDEKELRAVQAIMSDEDVDAEAAFLIRHKYDPAKCSNRMFQIHSTEWHTIEWLKSVTTSDELKQEFKDRLEASGSITDAGDCVPAVTKQLNKKIPTQRYFCGPCGGSKVIRHQTTLRVFAAMKLHQDQWWKLVISSKPTSDEKSRYTGEVKRPWFLYDVSHFCNVYNENNSGVVCATPVHFQLETKLANTARKYHHTGDKTCVCEPPCIGERVRTTPDPTDGVPSRKKGWHNAGVKHIQTIALASGRHYNPTQQAILRPVGLDDTDGLETLPVSVACAAAIALLWSDLDDDLNVDQADLQNRFPHMLGFVSKLAAQSPRLITSLLVANDDQLPLELRSMTYGERSNIEVRAIYWMMVTPLFRNRNRRISAKMQEWLDQSLDKVQPGTVYEIYTALGIQTPASYCPRKGDNSAETTDQADSYDELLGEPDGNSDYTDTSLITDGEHHLNGPDESQSSMMIDNTATGSQEAWDEDGGADHLGGPDESQSSMMIDDTATGSQEDWDEDGGADHLGGPDESQSSMMTDDTASASQEDWEEDEVVDNVRPWNSEDERKEALVRRGRGRDRIVDAAKDFDSSDVSEYVD